MVPQSPTIASLSLSLLLEPCDARLLLISTRQEQGKRRDSRSIRNGDKQKWKGFRGYPLWISLWLRASCRVGLPYSRAHFLNSVTSWLVLVLTFRALSRAFALVQTIVASPARFWHTVEPRPATSVIRSPRYCGHFFFSLAEQPYLFFPVNGHIFKSQTAEPLKISPR